VRCRVERRTSNCINLSAIPQRGGENRRVAVIEHEGRKEKKRVKEESSIIYDA